MTHSIMFLALGALAASAAGVPAWARLGPRSFWWAVGFPAKAIRVYLTWAHAAASCGLAAKRRRWRWTLDAVPLAGSLPRTSVLLAERRRVRRVEVQRAPGLEGCCGRTGGAGRCGYGCTRARSPATTCAPPSSSPTPGASTPSASPPPRPAGSGCWPPAPIRSPTSASPPEAGELLTVRPGMLETGQPWVIDFRTVPHWLNAGASQSGKSNLANAIIKGLAPQPVALAGFDLKGGVEFTPYAPRLSALATTRAESCDLLDDLVRLLADRMRTCREHGARNIWRLPDAVRPMPVVVLVDEVAELFLMADKSEKDQVSRTATGLLRVAQLGRAFGVYLIICGQRIGADLGPGVTALRAQLTGRICHHVNDPETATMTLGDLDPAALDAARAIPADTPGVAIVTGQDGSWHRARSVLVSEDDAEHAARTYAYLAPDWATLTRTGPLPASWPQAGDDAA